MNAMEPKSAKTGSRARKIRLDAYLVDAGWFDSRADALGPIMAGLVVVDGAIVTKPGTAVKQGAEIFIRGKRLRYASRGGYKLAWALERFHLELNGRVALDAGASTGGFTDCLLQAGCRRVYAVDAGFGQLRGRLAADARVVNLERTNISDLTRDAIAEVDFCSADLSYLSLRKAVPILREKCGPVEMVCLVKPLYEGLDESRKGDASAMVPVLEGLIRALAAAGNPVTDLTPSPLFGGRGALEFLIHLAGEPESGPGMLLTRAMDELERRPPGQEVP